MKYLSIFFISLLLFSCGENKGEKKDTSLNKETGVDFSNKGIGPIKELKFDAINEELVQKGAAAYRSKCTACHAIDKKLIGPALKGIYKRRSPEWVVNLLLNPTEMLKKDPIAMALLKEYNNIMMLNQNLSEDEALAIAEFMRTL